MIDLHFWRTPWIRPHTWQGQTLDEFPSHVGMTSPRAPRCSAAWAVLRDRLERNRAKPAGHAWEILFNQPAANP